MRVTATKGPMPPLTRLVLFLVCLSAAGALLAGVQYLTMDLPQQQNIHAPSNAAGHTDCWNNYMYVCLPRCAPADDACETSCSADYYSCDSCYGNCDADFITCATTFNYAAGDCEGIRDMCKEACLA